MPVCSGGRGAYIHYTGMSTADVPMCADVVFVVTRPHISGPQFTHRSAVAIRKFSVRKLHVRRSASLQVRILPVPVHWWSTSTGALWNTDELGHSAVRKRHETLAVKS